MCRSFIIILLTFIFADAFSQNKNVTAITSLNQAWLNCYPKKDTAALNKILADDFVLISPKGTKMSKHDVIASMYAQEIVSVHIDSSDVKMLSTEVGIITVYTTFVFKSGDKELTGQNCYQDVYEKRKGKWLAVAAHVTLLNSK
jgi:uncharacterized protein (TIGR02246 family)